MERDRRTWWWVLGLTALGATLRLVGLGAQSLWNDEGFTAQVAQLSLGKLHDALADDTHPPLFYWLEKVAVMFGTDEWHLRFVPFLAATAILPMVFLLARELLDSKTGLIATAICAITPVQVWYAQEARSTSLFMLIVVTTTWLLIVVIRDKRRLPFVGYVLLLAAGFYTHYFAVFLFAAHVAIVVALRIARELDRAAAVRWGWAAIGALVLAAPILYALVVDDDRSSLDWIAPMRARDLVEVFTFAWLGVWEHKGVVVVGVVIVLMVGGTVVAWPRSSARPALGAKSRRHGIGLVVLLCLIVVPIVGGVFASLVVRPLLLPRYYLAFVAPALYILVAHGIARRSTIVGVAFAALLTSRLAPLTYTTITSLTKGDWRGEVARLETLAPDVAIVYTPWWIQRAFSYYAPSRWGRAIDETFAAEKLCTLAAHHPQVILIWAEGVADSSAVYSRFRSRWREVAVHRIAGEIHAEFHISTFETTRAGCPDVPPPQTSGPFCEKTFRLEGYEHARWVWVTGGFVGWGEPLLGAIAMTRGDGAWTITHRVSAGEHHYKFIINESEWMLDPKNPDVAVGPTWRNSMFTCVP